MCQSVLLIDAVPIFCDSKNLLLDLNLGILEKFLDKICYNKNQSNGTFFMSAHLLCILSPMSKTSVVHYRDNNRTLKLHSEMVALATH